MYYAIQIGFSGLWVAVPLATVIGLGGAIYLGLWKGRFRRNAGLLRVRGRIAGPGEPGRPVLVLEPHDETWPLPPLELGTFGGRRWKVIGSGAELSCRRGARYKGRRIRWLQVGDPITVDGLPVPVACRESDYRTQAAEVHLEATRVIRGAWPEVRWLRWLVVPSVAVALVGAVVLLGGERHRFELAPVDITINQRDLAEARPYEVLSPGQLVRTTNCVMVQAYYPEDRVPAACRPLLEHARARQQAWRTLQAVRMARQQALRELLSVKMRRQGRTR